MEMNGSEIDRTGVGSVKAAISFYGDKIADNNSKKTYGDFSAKSSPKGREPQNARRNVDQKKERRWAVESEQANAKNRAEGPSSKIGESSSKAKVLVVRENESYDYEQVMRELQFVKQELEKLKLDVAPVIKEKLQADEQIKASRLKILSGSRAAEELRKELEDINEEHVLAELARMEALKELRDVETQREKEETQFLSKMETTMKKMKQAADEIEKSKELEMKLAVTMSDVEMLQNELNSVRELDESGGSCLLQNITEELEAAKKELASIKEEGFQFMASIDIIRNELNHVTAELAQVKKEEEKVESKVQNLNSKLLRAKSKLETVSNAEEKAKSIAMSLSVSLKELEEEAEAARKEKETQENRTTKEEIKSIELEIDMTEEKLEAAMQELEVIKALESEALEKLRNLTENTMRERALAAKHSSSITISKFEYDYLTNHAAVAEEIVDKKVEAAQAWIKALKASEHEISVRTKIALREIKETKKEVEIMEVNAKEKEENISKRSSRDGVENPARKREKSSSNHNLQKSTSRKSIKLSNGTMVPAKQAKFQKSASPAGRHVSPFTMRKNKKVITHLASFFKGKRNRRNSYKRENGGKQ